MNEEDVFSKPNLIIEAHLTYKRKTLDLIENKAYALSFKTAEDVKKVFGNKSFPLTHWPDLSQIERWKRIKERVKKEIAYDCLHIEVRTDPNKNSRISVSIDDVQEIALCRELTEVEYVKRKNHEKYAHLLKEKKLLVEDSQEYQENEPQFSSIKKRMVKINKWIEILSDWFLENGHEIPQNQGSYTNSDSKTDEKFIMNGILVYKSKVLELKSNLKEHKDIIKKLEKYGKCNVSSAEMIKLIDDNRFKSSGKANFSKIGKAVGRDHETAIRWVKHLGLLPYGLKKD